MMKRLKKSIVYIFSDILGQVVIAMLLLLAIVAWTYFSSVYAAITVLVIAFLLWHFILKIIEKDKDHNPD